MIKINPSEITPHSTYINRRNLIKSATAFSIASSLTKSVNAMHNHDTSKYEKFLDNDDKLKSILDNVVEKFTSN